jgi:hypothetical protein
MNLGVETETKKILNGKRKRNKWTNTEKKSVNKEKKRYIGWLCEHLNENPKIPEKKLQIQNWKSSYPTVSILLWKIQ